MITYEYPLNERIRTLLRLENLFQRALYYSQQDGQNEHHATLMALFETLDVASRGDLKMDLIQELERQKQILRNFRDSPGVAEERLDEALAEIEQAASALHELPGKFGQYLKESEWLMAIRSRATIPGGACEFDLPSYHFWLNRDSEARKRDLNVWLAPMQSVRTSVGIVLKLLRSSASSEKQVAHRGAYRFMFAGRNVQMLRVSLSNSLHCVPEISANKYLANIRFVQPETVVRPRTLEENVDFELAFCNL